MAMLDMQLCIQHAPRAVVSLVEVFLLLFRIHVIVRCLNRNVKTHEESSHRSMPEDRSGRHILYSGQEDPAAKVQMGYHWSLGCVSLQYRALCILIFTFASL